ncbi:MAG TPA: S9 family peptidase [Pyrinomonadaceae bacterium]|jgi:dipeptidyl aminopeptidase/acylaminoacyl peptidase|nr:S9 family peptidase [Pyrinomonadaceae bacterium]
MHTKNFSRLLVFVLLATTVAVAQTARHPLRLDDLARFRNVGDPQISPDGDWIAYTVSTIDTKEDKSNTHIWMVKYDGTNDRQITFSNDSEGSPRWSPDGKYLSFTSSRSSGKPGVRGSQLWLLDRSGGEAYQLTDFKGRLQGYEWSPDAKRIAVLIGDPDPDAPDPSASPTPGVPPKPPKPIVIDRYRYKQDVQGYLLSGRHTYIYLYDIATKKLERLTKSKWDESSISWSPDGSKIAFMSNHADDPDRDPSAQLYVAEAKPGVTEKLLTTPENRANRSRPEWTADGQWIGFLQGDERKYGAYSMEHLMFVRPDGSSPAAPVVATEKLDRGVSGFRAGNKGVTGTFLVTDDRSVYPVRLDGALSVTRLLDPPVVVSSLSMGGSHTVLLCSDDNRPTEICAMEGKALRRITHQNDTLMSELQIPETQEVNFKSKDGTEVHGLLTYPVGYVKGTKVPFLLRIHGGPNSQDQHAFATERQVFAANGYAVLVVNYRGSSGRGQSFSRSIFADWGHYEVEDLIAGVDKAIAMGVADPERMGIGGWSYGGILTDYMIATDTRFKGATSGAGTAFTVAFYGTDQYIIQYDYEIGPPWNPKAWETYVKISYPFLHADRIKTPTLFLGGERDFNVPVQGGQQMYQALRSLGVETQLVIYPNEFHGITRPSYVRDRYQRYLDWYDKYVKGNKPPVRNVAETGTP